MKSLLLSFGVFNCSIVSYLFFFYLRFVFMVPYDISQMIIKFFCTTQIKNIYIYFQENNSTKIITVISKVLHLALILQIAFSVQLPSCLLAFFSSGEGMVEFLFFICYIRSKFRYPVSYFFLFIKGIRR